MALNCPLWFFQRLLASNVNYTKLFRRREAGIECLSHFRSPECGSLAGRAVDCCGSELVVLTFGQDHTDLRSPISETRKRFVVPVISSRLAVLSRLSPATAGARAAEILDSGSVRVIHRVAERRYQP